MSAIQATTDTGPPRLASVFVRKLYRILDVEDTEVIAWDTSGSSFTINDQVRLSSQILPKYYRGGFDSFRLQLLDHGFERVASVTFERMVNGSAIGSSGAPQEAESYQHDSFLRGNPQRLSEIVRIAPSKRRRSVKTTASLVSTSPAVRILPQAALAPVASSSSSGPSDKTACTHDEVARWLSAVAQKDPTPQQSSSGESDSNGESRANLESLQMATPGLLLEDNATIEEASMSSEWEESMEKTPSHAGAVLSRPVTAPKPSEEATSSLVDAARVANDILPMCFQETVDMFRLSHASTRTDAVHPTESSLSLTEPVQEPPSKRQRSTQVPAIPTESITSQDSSPAPESSHTPNQKTTHEDVAGWLNVAAQNAARPREPSTESKSQEEPSSSQQSLKSLVRLVMMPWSVPYDEENNHTVVRLGNSNLRVFHSAVPCEPREFSKDMMDTMLDWCESKDGDDNDASS